MSAKKKAKKGTKAKAPKRTKRAKPGKSARASASRKAVRKPAKRAAKKTRKPSAAARTKSRASARKAPAKKAAAKKPRKLAQAKAVPLPRRDGAGHLNPRYEAELRALSREGHTNDDNRAFFNKAHSSDDLAEELGEQAVETMNSGEDDREEMLDQTVTEEQGGPFVVTPAGREFADGVDESNPEDATREPFPKT